MWSILRITFGLLLASLIVSLTAAQGLMRGPSEYGQNTIVICTGHGLSTITLDHNGEPVEAAPECPDTSIVSLDGVPLKVNARVVLLRAAELSPMKPFDVLTGFETRPAARGPPVVV